MAVVVDASALGAIAFGEPEGATLAAHLSGETLLAPRLLDYELSNVALKKARKRPDDVPKILLSLRAALALPISRLDVPAVEVVALASNTGLTAYDAAYLWLSRSKDLELVSLDARLKQLAD